MRYISKAACAAQCTHFLGTKGIVMSGNAVLESLAPRQTVFAGQGPSSAVRDGNVLMHVILFEMYEGTTEGVRDEALRLMVAMCQDIPGIIKWHVAESSDYRKGVVLSEVIVFESNEAFEEFKRTPGHMAYAAFIRCWANWKISDYVVPVAFV